MVPTSRRPRRQRGAIGLLSVLTLLLALTFTALAVDAGRLWFEKRKLQSIADIAALEAARNAGCGGRPGDIPSAAQAAAVRNGYAGDLANAPNAVETGWLEVVDGRRGFVLGAPAGNGGDADAVHVRATRSVPASLVLGGVFGRDTLIAAEATARAEPPQASFSLGSRLLRLGVSNDDRNLLNSLLGGLLGSSLTLDAVGYEGLANTSVNLADLVRLQGASTVEQLLDAQLTVAEVIGLSAAAVSGQSAVDVGVTNAMQSLLAASVKNATVRLGDVLNVAVPASRAAAEAGINVLDLITTTAMVANQTHVVELDLGISGVAKARLEISQPPQIAVGPPGASASGDLCAEARTAQVGVTLDFLPNGINILGLATIDLDMALRVSLAQSRANLAHLDPAAGTATAIFDVEPGIADLRLTRRGNANQPGLLRGKLLFIVIDIAEIGLNLPVAEPQDESLTFPVDYPAKDHLPATQSTHAPLGGSLKHALGQPDAVTVKLLSIINLGDILNPVLSLLGNIGGVLLDPLLKLLGVEAGGADVTLEDIQYRGGAQLVI